MSQYNLLGIIHKNRHFLFDIASFGKFIKKHIKNLPDISNKELG